MIATLPRFLVVGACGFMADICLFLGLTFFLPLMVARGAALLLAVTTTWWLNRTFTFHAGNDSHLFAQWGRYAAGSALGAGINGAVSLMLISALPGLGSALSISAGSAAALSVNYLTARHIAFKVVRRV